MANNKTTGLLLLGGATGLYLYSKNKSEDKPQTTSSGGSGGGYYIVGQSEVTNPNSTKKEASMVSYPDINIYESSIPSMPTANVGTSESSSSTKKQGANLFQTQYLTNDAGELVGVQDSIFSPNPQSRIPNEIDKIAYSVQKARSGVGTDSLGQSMSISPTATTKKQSTVSEVVSSIKTINKVSPIGLLFRRK